MYDFHKVNLPGHYSVFSHNTFDPKKYEIGYLGKKTYT